MKMGVTKWIPRFGFISLVCADMAMAFLWVFLNSILSVSIDVNLPYIGMDTKKLVKKSCVVALLFIFYGLSKLTRGATYNPLTIIAYAAADITHLPLYLLSLRVPAQIIGAVCGAFVSVSCVPNMYRHLMTGPYLRVSPHVGALIECVLTFGVVFIALASNIRGPASGIRRTWITSISRVSISILGANYTGPAMNPANAFGWAYWKNQHNTWEHFYVFWIAPLLATLLAVWLARAILVPRKVKVKQS